MNDANSSKIQAIIDLVFDQIHQLLSNLIGNSHDDRIDGKADAEEALINCTIETWAQVAMYITTANLKDWSYFLEGRGAWTWFANTRRKIVFEEVWKEQVAKIKGQQNNEADWMYSIA